MHPSGSNRSPSAHRGPSRRRITWLAVLGAAAMPALAGCSTYDLPTFALPYRGVTNQSDRISLLWQGSWIAALGVGVIVWSLIIGSCIFFRRRRGTTGLPPQVRYNLPVEALYTVVPFIVIAVLFFYTARDEAELQRITNKTDHVVNVVGKQWSWDFNYVTERVYEPGTPAQPPTLVLPAGKSVQFVLTSRDVIHSFWVPAFLYKQDVIPGRVNRFEVTPLKIGTYAGKCAELCGQDHSRMLFTVKIVSPADYARYIQDLRARGQVGQLGNTLNRPRNVETSK